MQEFACEELHVLQGNKAGQGSFTGLVVASSLALGTCKAFRFKVAPSGQVVAARPPEDAGKKKSQRGLRANWGLIELQGEPSPDAGGSCNAMQCSMMNTKDLV